MRRVLIALLACGLGSCGSRMSGPSQADSKTKSGKPNAPKESAVKVPDPKASKDPNAGHQAGLGDDPSNLEVADPNTGTAGSGGRQAHATR